MTKKCALSIPALLSYFLEFFAVDLNDGMHIPPGVEVCNEFHGFGFKFGVEGIEDFIGGVLMGDMSVHKRVDVEFECFEFDHFFVGNVGELHGRKVRVA